MIADIIPAVSKLRQEFDIKFTTMFSYHLLIEHGYPVYIKSSDLLMSDAFFDSIAFK